MAVFVIRNIFTGRMICDNQGNFKMFYGIKNARDYRKKCRLNHDAYEIKKVKLEELK